MFGYTRAADESLGSDTVDRVDSLGCQVGILLDIKYSCRLSGRCLTQAQAACGCGLATVSSR